MEFVLKKFYQQYKKWPMLGWKNRQFEVLINKKSIVEQVEKFKYLMTNSMWWDKHLCKEKNKELNWTNYGLPTKKCDDMKTCEEDK